MGDRGHQYVYRLDCDEEGRPVDRDLTTPEEVAQAAKRAHIEVTP